MMISADGNMLLTLTVLGVLMARYLNLHHGCYHMIFS